MKIHAMALLAAGALCSALPAQAQTVAITGGTVYPVSGPKIENGTVILKDGKVAAVGAGIPIPAGATRIDATGKVVTPGFFHGFGDYGLTGVQSVGETRERTHAGDVNPSFNVAEGIDPAAVTIPIARMQGITTAFVGPADGLIAGQGTIIDLSGDRLEDLVAVNPAAMVLSVGTNAKDAGGGSRAGVMERLRQLFSDALEYQRRKGDYDQNRMQALSAPAADLAALGPVLAGKEPVIVEANRRSDIENALRLAQEFHLKMMIQGGTEAWMVAPELAKAGVPVLVENLTDVPRFDGLHARLDNATVLAQAGVKVVIAQNDDSRDRDLRFAAGNAVRNGMTWDQALRAVTLSPAEAYGVADRWGSLEPGKAADVVVWSGDPFEFSSRAEHVFIRGAEVPMVSRMTELLDRYRSLPPKYF
ncbi:MAG TPA: amidohydrolase family protein [Gemmatimonadales bacterium]|jgi:imidazolonepropionase-like amidohydrolase|nr:amidohydrolase family protein [Gemmatimonadales bacterium]